MKTKIATPHHYEQLNRSSELKNNSETDSVIPLNAAFYTRVGELWFDGKSSHGRSGIVPRKPFPCALPQLSLEFYLVTGDERVRFSCGKMSPEAAAVHSDMFTCLYASDEFKAENADQEGRWLEMKLAPAAKVIVPDPGAPPAVLPAKKVREWRPKRKAKADPFDPLSGISY